MKLRSHTHVAQPLYRSPELEGVKHRVFGALKVALPTRWVAPSCSVPAPGGGAMPHVGQADSTIHPVSVVGAMSTVKLSVVMPLESVATLDVTVDATFPRSASA